MPSQFRCATRPQISNNPWLTLKKTYAVELGLALIGLRTTGTSTAGFCEPENTALVFSGTVGAFD